MKNVHKAAYHATLLWTVIPVNLDCIYITGSVFHLVPAFLYATMQMTFLLIVSKIVNYLILVLMKQENVKFNALKLIILI